jgi:hypothetical protein
MKAALGAGKAGKLGLIFGMAAGCIQKSSFIL